MNRDEKALLKLDYRCNNNCYFCWANGYGVEDEKVEFTDTESLVEKVGKARETGVDMVVLTGGEPSIRDNLEKILGAVRENGLKAGMASNLRMFKYQDFTDRMVEEGVCWVHGTFYTSNRETYQDITRTDSLEQNLQGLENCVEHPGIELVVNHVVTSENVEELEENLGFLLKKGVDYVKISLVNPLRTARTPGLERFGEEVDQALERFEGEDIEFFLEGVPFCLTSNRDIFTEWDEFNITQLSEAFEESFHPPATKYKRTEVCERCPKDDCPGVYKEHMERFPEKTRKTLLNNRPS